MEGPRKVLSKKECYALIARKITGNMLRNWTHLEDVLNSGFDGLLRLRYSGAGGNSRFSYAAFAPDKLPNEFQAWVQGGINPGDIMVCEAAPDEALKIQGEVYLSPEGMELWYSTVNGITCREAMQSPTKASGIEAVMLLKLHMDPASYDDLQCLFEIYPDSVIEFSTYSHAVGWARRNTVFWEVRNY